MFDDSLALGVLRLAVNRGLLPGDTAALLPTSADSIGPTQRSAAALLTDLLTQGRLTLDDVHALREQVAATFVTEPGDEAAPQDATREALPLPIVHERYEIEQLIGQGGMGQVYKARDLKLNRVVALKFLRVNDDGTAQRLFREARAQARIAHPSVCQVYDVGQYTGQLYIAMEYHDGESLSQARFKLTLDEKVLLIKQVAEALQAAHHIGIIHRDIKSSNILAVKGDVEGWRAVLLDFGLARDLEASEHMTRTGAVLGTPAYMSPEQVRGEHTQIDRRTDVYSTGAVLYELLTGTPPFAGDPQLTTWRTLHEEVVPPRQRDASIPIDLETIALTCLEKERHRRYQSALALADDLARYLAGMPITARKASAAQRMRRFLRRHWVPVGVAALVLIGACGVVGVSVRDQRQAEHRARLAQQLGREVELSDMFLRMAYSFPLHDLTKEESVVRERISRMKQQLVSLPPLEASLAHYAIGRSLLKLRSYGDSVVHLQAALDQGLQDPEVEQFLGQALGARYLQAESQLDSWENVDDWVRERRRQLRAEYLVPARQHLERGRSAQGGETLLNSALLSLYREEYEPALQAATEVLAAEPWRSEAKKIIGDVHAAIAKEHWRHGRFDEARRSNASAYEHYRAALAMSRSDPSYLLAAAQLHLSEMSLEMYHGGSPLAAYEKCISLSRDIQTLLPDSIDARAVRIMAMIVLLRYLTERGASSESYEAQALADVAFMAQREPNHSLLPHAQPLLYMTLAESRLRSGRPLGDLLTQSEQAAYSAIARHENPARAYHQVGDLYALIAYQEDVGNRDPRPAAEKSLKAYREGVRSSPRRDGLYEAALLISRNAVFPFDMAGGLNDDWIRDAEQLAQQGLGISSDSFLLHHYLGGVYLDFAELRSQRDEQAAELLAKAERSITRAIELLPTHAPSLGDLASLYRLRARAALYVGQEHSSLLEKAHSAMRRSLHVNARDTGTQLANAKLLLLSAESEVRARRGAEKLLSELEVTLSQVPFVGWQVAAAELLRGEAMSLRAVAHPDQRTALLAAALRHVDRAVALRPKWPLAQRRRAELAATLQASAPRASSIKQGG